MSVLDKLIDVFKKKDDKPLAKRRVLGTPITGGRSTVPEGGTFFNSLVGDMQEIKPELPPEMYDLLIHLVKYNDDMSFALDNIVQLGNTDYEISFDDSISDKQKDDMLEAVNSKINTWYTSAGGVNSLINDLLAQCAVTGAISAEIVPSLNLDGVERIVKVNPKTIKFVYDKESTQYLPYQNSSLISNIDHGGELIKLNPLTYKYLAIRRFDETPYAVPPFLSALESVGVERDMMKNFKHIVKQLGTFGFLQVSVDIPDKSGVPDANGNVESDAAYIDRSRNFMVEMANQVKHSLPEGFIIGKKDEHEFEMKGNLANPRGARELSDMITEKKMAGLKQDPLMLGRNFSTTETVATVIITKLSAQIVSYQKLVATFLEDAVILELKLQGFVVNNVKIKFAKPMLADEAKKQNSFSTKIDNYNKLYVQGVISQTQRAQLLGFEKADKEKPRGGSKGFTDEDDDAPTNDDDDDDDGVGSNSQLTDLEAIEYYTSQLGVGSPEFDYGSTHSHGGGQSIDSLNVPRFPNKAMRDIFEKYSKDTGVVYRKAVKDISKKITARLAKMPADSSLRAVDNAVKATLYRNWDVQFTKKQLKVISRWVDIAYKKFRKDKAIFDKLAPKLKKKVPNQPTFKLSDLRTMRYFKASDDLYMSKFITDSDTRGRLTRWVKDKFVAGDLPLGKNKDVLKAFQDEFGTLFEGEEFKLYRIISTTTSKLKTYASINYMKQAELKSFEIVGINDRLQCAYCREMQGRRFSINKWADEIDKFTSSDPSDVKSVAPFINTVFKGEEGVNKVKQSTNAELEAAGIAVPPYHPNCRDEVIAID